VLNVLVFFLILILTQCIGLISSIPVMSAVQDWYPLLIKPFFAPPNWLFGPVWTILYTMMAIAAFLVWRKGWKHPCVPKALGWYALQLFINGCWSVVFFGGHSPELALVDILLLISAIIITMRYFFRIDRRAGWLLVPYLAWVSFATLLNAGIVWLN
jgi:tryptophan-rich sensory protein